MPGNTASLASVGNPTPSPRKTHGRRESSGHVCTACDQCYRCKVRCSGEKPTCERCRTNKSACTYSTGKPLGKPKGSKNKVQRSRVNSDVRVSTAVGEKLKADWSQKSPIKRSGEEGLPPPKRRGVDSPTISSCPLQGSQIFQSPRSNTSELPALLAQSVEPDDTITSVAEPLPYYVNSSKMERGFVKTPPPPPSKIDDVFVPGDIGLDLEDFQWFTQTESYMHTPPTGASTQAEFPAPEVAQHPTIQPQQPPSASSLSTPVLPIASPFPQLASLQCLCDPLSLSIISELQVLQVSLSPLDTALIIARRGLSTVSSYLSCPSCLSHLSSSPSLLLACVLILQQVFACYVALRMQGSRLLQPPDDVKRLQKQHQHSIVSIGEFEVEGGESCNGVLEAIVKAEMERGKGVIGGLERWVETADDGREKVAGILLRNLREEIGWSFA